MEIPTPTVEVVPYSSAKSARKAGTQTAASMGVLFLTFLAAAVTEPRVLDYVNALGVKVAWLPVLFVVLRLGAGVVMDRLKHRGPDGELVETAPPQPVVIQGEPDTIDGYENPGRIKRP